MREMSMVLLATGAVSAMCIVIFFCYLFIGKQRRRTAIERCLGMTNGQCARSLLAGIVVIALSGCSAGAFAGQYFAGTAAAQMAFAETFDTRFSNGEIQFNRERSEQESGAVETAYLTETDWRISAACGGLVFLFTLASSLSGIYGNLRQEPLKLLSEAGK